MAAKRVQQKDVKWVPKDKKTGKGGFLALRSEPTKPFSGIVTNIKAGTTRSSGGEAVYKGGRNVQRMKDRAAAAKGTGAAKESAASYVSKKKPAAPPSGAPSAATRGATPAARQMFTQKERESKGQIRPYNRGTGKKITMPGGNARRVEQLEFALRAYKRAAATRAQQKANTAAAKAAAARDAARIKELEAALKKARG
jgi:hypothetical protein